MKRASIPYASIDEIGLNVVTRVTFEWEGEFYGCSFPSALDPGQLHIEKMRFETRRMQAR